MKKRLIITAFIFCLGVSGIAKAQDNNGKTKINIACNNTLAAGVVAAVCAGNSRQIQMLAPVPYNIWSPGDCPPPHLHEDQLVNPGGTSCVICVGAVDYNDAWFIPTPAQATSPSNATA